MKSFLLFCAFLGSCHFLNAQSFSIAVSPSLQSITVGEVATYSVDITPLNGFNATIFLEAASPTFMGSVVLSNTTPNPPYSKIKLQIKPAIQDTGTRILTITAKNGMVQSQATVTLITQKNIQWTTIKPPSKIAWASPLKTDDLGNIFYPEYNLSSQNGNVINIYRYKNQQWVTESFNPSLYIPQENNNVPFDYKNNYNNVFDKNGVFWFGTPDGLAKYDGKFTSLFNTSNSEFPLDNVVSLRNDKDGFPLCIATEKTLNRELTILKYNGTSWTSIKPQRPITELYAYWFFDICIDSSNRIWVPSERSGIVRIQDTLQENINSQSNPPIWNNKVRKIVCDKDGEMWCMYNYSPMTIAISHFDGTVWKHINTPTQSELYTFIVDNDKNVWLGSDEGLHKYDGTAWTTYNKNNSPLPIGVKFLIQDKHNNIWMNVFGSYYIFNPTGLVGIPIAPSSVSEQPAASDGIHLFPNPTSTTFTLSGVEGVASVRVVNSLGEEVRKWSEAQGTQEIDVSNLANGLYFVSIRTVTGAVVKPIIVSH